MTVNAYRKKPLVVQAWQIPFEVTKSDSDELIAFLGIDWGLLWDGRFFDAYQGGWGIQIKTREGIMRGYSGDYIIKGIAGEFYPCNKEIFENSYDKVEEFNV